MLRKRVRSRHGCVNAADGLRKKPENLGAMKRGPGRHQTITHPPRQTCVTHDLKEKVSIHLVCLCIKIARNYNKGIGAFIIH